MADFTFSLRLGDAPYLAMDADHPSALIAINTAKIVLQAKIDASHRRSRPAQTATAGVGCGSMFEDADQVLWLGEWAWSAAAGWLWQPSG